MNTELKTALSNNNLRRMQGWARGKYPKDAPDRCAVVIEYLAQLCGAKASYDKHAVILSEATVAGTDAKEVAK